MSIPEWLLSVGSGQNEVDPRIRFDNEMEFLLKWLSLSKMEQKLRRSIYNELLKISETTLQDCKVESIGSYYSGMQIVFCFVLIRMLPDSDIDLNIISKAVTTDTIKLVQAITVTMKYEEILCSTPSSSLSIIDFKHIYSGISIRIEVCSECNTSFSNFIRYAKRVSGYKPLYSIFRYFIRQYNINLEPEQKMIIHFLIIYFLQSHLQ